MNPDINLKEKVQHGTTHHPITGLHFANGKETSYPESFFVDRHWHSQVEILYFTEGRFEVEINLTKHIYEEGDICILNGEDLHQIKGLSDRTSHDAILFDEHILNFSYMDEFEEKCLQPLMNHTIFFPHSITKDDTIYPMVISCMKKLVESALKKEAGWYINSKITLLSFLALLYNSGKFIAAEREGSSSYDKKISYYKTVVSYMEQHLEDHVTLQDLADAIPCNSQYLCRLFKEVSGVSPIQYFISQRIKKACHLLSHTSLGVLEIALECGFENFSYFIRAFKKQMHLTPGEYRSRHWEKNEIRG